MTFFRLAAEVFGPRGEDLIWVVLPPNALANLHPFMRHNKLVFLKNRREVDEATVQLLQKFYDRLKAQPIAELNADAQLMYCLGSGNYLFAVRSSILQQIRTIMPDPSMVTKKLKDRFELEDDPSVFEGFWKGLYAAVDGEWPVYDMATFTGTLAALSTTFAKVKSTFSALLKEPFNAALCREMRRNIFERLVAARRLPIGPAQALFVKHYAF